MIKRIKANLKEFCLGLFVLTLSVSGSCLMIRKLYPSVFSGANTLNLINKRQESFNLINRESLCVGGFRTLLQKESESTEFNLTGNLFLNIQNKLLNSALNLQTVFNPLNQMVASVMSLKGEDFELLIGMLNVNPIEVTLMASVKSRQVFKNKFSFPGPVRLAEEPGQLYLEYGPTGQKIPLAFRETARALLEIELKPIAADKQICEQSSAGSIDLLLESSQLQTRLRKLIPGFSADLLAVLENKLNSELQNTK